MDKKVYLETFRLESNYWWHVSKRRLVQQAIKKTIGKSQKIRLLDAGCGTGIMMLELQTAYPDIYGLDRSTLALKFCRKRGLTNVHRGDLERKLPFKKNLFDGVTCLDVIEHLNHDHLVLEEFGRILKPKGYLFITVPAYQFLWTKHDEILWHKRRYRRGNLVKLVESCGFRVKKASYFYSFLIPPAILLFKLKLIFNKGRSKTTVIPPKPINFLLMVICALERKVLERISLPTGISILLVAQKI